MNTILVSSHRRSGTHFLIDSLRMNIRDAQFPNHRYLPADFNLGSLFSKQEKVYAAFTELIAAETPVIIKSHLLPEECNIRVPKDKYEELIKVIFQESQKVYISRAGKDVLVSLYRYLKPTCSFSSFIRENNDHIVKEIRTIQDCDRNRVFYWSYHVDQWHKETDVKQILFSDLMENFSSSMEEILQSLDFELPDVIKKPRIPRNMLWHGILKRLNHYGLSGLPESSSVRPNRGSKSRGSQYFTDMDDEEFYQQNKELNTIG